MTRTAAWLTAMLVFTNIAVAEGQASLPKWDLDAYRQDPAGHVAMLKAHLTTRIPHIESARRYAIDLRTDIEHVPSGDRDRASTLSEIDTVIASLTPAGRSCKSICALVPVWTMTFSRMTSPNPESVAVTV